MTKKIILLTWTIFNVWFSIEIVYCPDAKRFVPMKILLVSHQSDTFWTKYDPQKLGLILFKFSVYETLHRIKYIFLFINL